MKQNNHFDIIVVGGGHAGVEAALICSKLSTQVALVTMSARAIGRMSCNPAIGGLAKGQMVREIDMLGGSMGEFADRSGIQFKVLNKTKGMSVWSPRAQVDKRSYELLVREKIRTNPIKVIEGEVVDLIIKRSVISGAVLRCGEKIEAPAVIVTCGTFLSGVIHIGERKVLAGRMGEGPSSGLTEVLTSMGFRCGRLKTGTPPRASSHSIDWKKTSEAFGDKNPVPFSYSTNNFNPKNIPCHTVQTGLECHDIIKNNLEKSAMFSGDIMGVGPRYCPSVEDKIHRFSHNNSHTLFLEPEWLGSDQIYINGFSTSLPESVQLEALRAIPALKNIELLRPGYAIEYDYFHPAQLKSSLESKEIHGLFFAGQINGTSGYEEAAAQGLLSGINAVSYLKENDPVILSRNQAYIGVMIDDLITKDTFEPYRMFTSRAEYRLMLRFSNTEERLYELSKSAGLLTPKRKACVDVRIQKKKKIRRSLTASLRPEEIINPKTKLKQGVPAKTLLKRPDVSIFDLPKRFLKELGGNSQLSNWGTREVFQDVDAEIKYSGYLDRHIKEIENLKNNELKKIPTDVSYVSMVGLSSEAKDKLSFVRPENIGQAMRISGVSTADISVVMINLRRK